MGKPAIEELEKAVADLRTEDIRSGRGWDCLEIVDDAITELGDTRTKLEKVGELFKALHTHPGAEKEISGKYLFGSKHYIIDKPEYDVLRDYFKQIEEE